MHPDHMDGVNDGDAGIGHVNDYLKITPNPVHVTPI